MPRKTPQPVQRLPVGLEEIEAGAVDTEQDAPVFAVEDVDAQTRDFISVLP